MSNIIKYSDMPQELNNLSAKVVDCIYQVHKNLGAGYLESIYEECLCIELKEQGIAFQRQFPINIVYKSKPVDANFRLDLVVEGKILIELKSVEVLLPVHQAQIYSYLNMAALSLGFLVNFNTPLIKDGIRRFVNKNLRNSASPLEVSVDKGVK